MREAAFYREAFDRESAALSSLTGADYSAPVPSCPGWTVGILLAHLTGIYARVRFLARNRVREETAISFEMLELPADFGVLYEAARSGAPAYPTPPQLPALQALFTDTAAEMAAALWNLDPAEELWNSFAAEPKAGFWQRRMALETAVHRWDAQLALGVPKPIEPGLAVEGIEETYDVLLAHRRRRTPAVLIGRGETYHLHRTDGPGEWLVEFLPEQPVVRREHAKGDIALRGSASDLLLWLWQRMPADQLEVFGDATLIEHYFRLVPPN